MQNHWHRCMNRIRHETALLLWHDVLVFQQDHCLSNPVGILNASQQQTFSCSENASDEHALRALELTAAAATVLVSTGSIVLTSSPFALVTGSMAAPTQVSQLHQTGRPSSRLWPPEYPLPWLRTGSSAFKKVESNAASGGP